ncbi:MAG: transposase [Planctomycetia bacterium]|nr:transposase [Planctomycetia bacterium]
MRFYQTEHPFYCGVDLHARKMYVTVVDQAGTTREQRNLDAGPEPFLALIRPYRERLVVGCECMFAWYWLADLCRAEAIDFVLGHALYTKANHGGKTKNDRIDSEKIARLLRGGMFPQAYVYPAEMRATRDLLRRRSQLVPSALGFQWRIAKAYERSSDQNRSSLSVSTVSTVTVARCLGSMS